MGRKTFIIQTTFEEIVVYKSGIPSSILVR